MRLFQSTYVQRGKARKARTWSGAYRDLLGRKRTLALSTNRAASARALRALTDLIQQASAGVVIDPRSVPPMIRERLFADLRDVGNISGVAEAAASPLAPMIEDWHAGMLAVGRTLHHADQQRHRVCRIIEVGRIKTFADIRPDRIERVIATLRSDAKKPIGTWTGNNYLTALKSFVNWLVAAGRAPTNPIAHLRRQNAAMDRMSVRRAITPDECRRLIAAAEKGEPFGPTRIDGLTRALLYRIALTTGLRAGELASLTVGSLDLAADPPTVTVEAGASKRRRRDVLPLRGDVADALLHRCAGLAPAARIFPAMPPSTETALMVRTDLDAAGIAVKDGSGRKVDFHALRHTFITLLAQSGVHPAVARELARHSTIDLTMRYYTHTTLQDHGAAVARLPDLGDLPAGKSRQRSTARAGRAS